MPSRTRICARAWSDNLSNNLYYKDTDFKLRKIIPETGEDLIVTDIAPDDIEAHAAGNIKIVGDYLFFRKNLRPQSSYIHGDLWRTDGTDENTIKLVGQNFWLEEVKPIESYAQIGNHFLFKGEDESGNFGLWSTDNTVLGTYFLKTLTSIGYYGTPPSISDLFELNGIYFFIIKVGDSTDQLWTTDGTIEGTNLVKNLPGFSELVIYQFQNSAFFTLDTEQYGVELWITNGSAEGTKLLFDLNEGEENSRPRELTLLNGNILFSATSNSYGTELWKFDVLTNTFSPLEKRKNAFEIFPNPAPLSGREIFIKSNLQKKSLADIKIYSIEGKLLSQTQEWLSPDINNVIKIPVKLSRGVYLLNLAVEHTVVTLKIVLQ